MSLNPIEHDTGYHRLPCTLERVSSPPENPCEKYKSPVFRQPKAVVRKHQSHTQGADGAATLCGWSPAIATKQLCDLRQVP